MENLGRLRAWVPGWIGQSRGKSPANGAGRRGLAVRTARLEPLEQRRLLAVDIGVGPGVHMGELSIDAPAEHDWYRFEVLRPDALAVSLSFNSAAGDLSLEFCDVAGTVLATGSATATGRLATTAPLSAGTYQIHVQGIGGATNQYALAIDSGPSSTTRVFYVNDASTVSDYYSIAAGNDANNGLSPATPKATVQDVLADYDIGPNDLVLVDTGTYAAAVTIGETDEGAAYAGSPAGSSFTNGGTRWDLVDADYNLIYGLSFTGSNGTGISVRPGAVDASDGNTLRGNRFSGTSTGINVAGGTGNVVLGNVFTGSGRTYDVYASSNPSLSVEANELAGATYGVSIANGTVIVKGNEIHHNTTGLICYGSGTTAYGNRVHDNTTGMEGYGTFGGTDWSAGQPNDVEANTTGIRTANSATVRFNRIHGNTVGVQANNYVGIHHNVIYRNSGQGILIDNSRDVTMENNTIYTPSGDGVRIRNSAYNVTLRNNIVWTDSGCDLYVATNSQQGFASDYNNLYATGGATLVWWQKPFTDLFDWQVEADFDTHSIGYTAPSPSLDNPQFVNLAGDDYHLTDTVSTSIDGGSAASAYSLEPGSNGGRIDLGAYGNTVQAAQSRARSVELEYPDYYADWPVSEGRPIQWRSYDAATGDHRLAGTVDLDLYQVGVGHIAHIATVPAADGSYGWSPEASGVAPGVAQRYRIRVTAHNDAAVMAESREAFSVPIAGHDYYVNDSSTAADEYSTAVGSNRATGKTPGDPKANLLPLLRSYDLGPEDVTHIDTGDYIHVRNVVLSGNQTQGNDEGVRITGPTDAAKTARIDRANTNSGSTNIEITAGDYVTLEHLTLAGAQTGLWVHNSSTHFAGRYLTVTDNSQDGLRLESDANASQLDYLTAANNAGTGIYVGTAIGSLCHSVAHHNGTGIYVWVSGSGTPTLIGAADLSLAAGNLVYQNTSTGIYAYGNVVVAGNTVWGHAGSGDIGISANGATVSGNVVYDNAAGIYGYSGSVEANRVYHNSEVGVWLGYTGAARGNVVYSNATGIDTTTSMYYGQIVNNLVYANTVRGIRISNSSGAMVANNTVYQEVGDAVRVEGSSTDSSSIRNNILWVQAGYAISVASESQRGFSSDYNVLYTTGTGQVALWQSVARPTLTAWQNTAFADGNSLAQDPRFVSPTGSDGYLGYFDAQHDGRDDDFHVQSLGGSYHGGSPAPVLDAASGLPVAQSGAWTADPAQSPSIDRGDPRDDFAREPLPSGGYVNLGAYGNTTQASLSPAEYLMITRPDGGEVWPAEQTFPVRWRTQDFGGGTALSFDGTDDLVSLPRDVLHGRTDTTVEFWLKTSELNAQSVLSAANSSADNEFTIYFDSATRLRVYDHGSSVSWAVSSIADSRWHHFAVVRSVTAGQLTLYVDGQSLGALSASLHALSVDANGLVVGQDQDSVGGGFGANEALSGQLDDLRIWSVPRTQAEIQSTMNATLAGTEAGLAGYWPFDEAAGTTAADRTANHFDGVLGTGTDSRPAWEHSTAPLSRLTLELIQDGQSEPVATIATLTANDGEFLWTIPSSIPPGTQYRVRATRTDIAVLSDISNQPFTITAPVHIYYVNDSQVDSGDWTTAAGSDSNTGLSAAAPKASLAAVLAAYDLGPGDVIKVDAGSYSLSSDVSIVADDTGVTIEGYHDTLYPSRKALINRANTSSTNAIKLTGADNVTLDHLWLTGASNGVYADAGSDDLTVSNCTVYGNAAVGLYLYNTVRARAVGNDVYSNTTHGIYTYGNSLAAADQIVVEANQVHDNGAYGIYANYRTLVRDNDAFRQSDSSDCGIYVSSATAQGNTVRDNGNGIIAYYSTVQGNRVYHNSGAGLSLGYSAVAVGNTVYSNSIGIDASQSWTFDGQILNNLVYANTNRGLRVTSGSGAKVLNNTVYQEVGDAVRVEGSSTSSITLRNNILSVQAGYCLSVASDAQAGFASDYNDLYATGTGKLALWQGREYTNLADWGYEIGQDQHSRSADPQWRDADGGDDVLGFSTVPVAGTAQVLDDGDMGFTLTGTWTTVASGAQGDSREATGTSGDKTATWSWSNLGAAGWYDVAVTWPSPRSGLSYVSPFTLWDGAAKSVTTTVNQQVAPADFSDGGVNWKRLGYFYVQSGQLSVQLANLNSSGGAVSADAVRIQRIAGDHGADDDFRVQGSSPTIDAGRLQDEYRSEPSPNGARINQGHTGNTAEATTSPAELIQVLAPNGREKYEAGQTVAIQWRTEADALAHAFYDDVVLADQPVGYWRLGEAAGTTAVDASGQGRNGSYVNGVVLGSPGVLSDNAAVTFDGDNDRIDLPAAVLNGLSDVTVEFWMKTTYTGAQAVLSGATSGNDNEYLLYFTSDTRLEFYTGENASSYVTWTFPSLADDLWHQVVMVRDATHDVATLYLDGVSQGSLSTVISALQVATGGLEIGQDQDSVGGGYDANQALTGRLDEVSVYNTAFSAEQALTHFRRSAYGPVNIDLLRQGSTTPVLSIAAAVANTGQFNWTIPESLAGGDDYLVRVTLCESPTVQDASDVPFLISGSGPDYYVNDGSTSGDLFCTAAGNNSFSGKRPDQPMASLSALLAAYDLDPGDVVHVDAGQYNLVRNVVLASEDSGVRIEGPAVAGHAAVLNRGNTISTAYAVEAAGADGVTLDHLALTGAYYGVYGLSGSDDLTIANCAAYGNASTGIYLTNAARARATGNDVYNNTYYGIYASGNSLAAADQIVVEANQVHDNGAYGIYANYRTLVRNNDAFRQPDPDDVGIYLNSAQAEANVVHDNGNGIIAYYSTVQDNRVCHNAGAGLSLGYSAVVVGNAVYSNSVGIEASRSWTFDGQILNNLVYANTNRGLRVTNGSGAKVINNTVYQEVGDAVRVEGSSTASITLRNNILSVQAGYCLSVASDAQAGFASDYNDLYATGTGKLALWQTREYTNLADWGYEIGQDQHSRNADPQWRDADGGDDVLGFSTVPVAGTAQVLDDGDMGFTLTGTWTTVASGAQGDSREAAGTSGDKTATWSWSNLGAAGWYDVAVTWPSPRSGLSYNSPFTLWDGAAKSVTTTVNQQVAPADFSDGGVNWKRLGYFYVQSGQLAVQLANLNNSGGSVSADAVRIQRVAGDHGADDDFRVASGSPTIDAGRLADEYRSEPAPNGGRINQGHTGNTAEATTSPAELIQVLAPNGREKSEAGQTVAIQWRTDADALAHAFYDDVVLADQPVGYWRLGEAAGTTAVDASGQGRNGSYVNGAVLGSPGVLADDTAVTFDGDNDRIDLPAAVLNGLSDVTVEFWMKTTYTGAQAVLSGATSGNDNEYLLEFGSDTTLYLYTGEYSSSRASWTFASVADAGWHHFVVVRDATHDVATLYLDGVSQGALSTTISPLQIAGLVIGQDQDSVGGGFDAGEALTGRLDELSIYSTAFSAANVGTHYRGTAYGPVNIDLLRQGSPTPVLSIASAAANTGQFDWTIPESLAWVDDYQVRVTLCEAPTVQDTSDAPFLVAGNGPDYYINDGSTAGDLFATVVGENGFSGKRPDRPMANLSALLSAYDLEPGDVIHVDAGQYNLVRNVVLTSKDSGVRIEGPAVAGHAAVLNRGNTASGSYVVQLTGADGVTLDHLGATGASYGIYAVSGTDDLTVSNCTVYGHPGWGIWFDRAARARAVGNETYSNSWGIYVNGSGLTAAEQIVVEANDVHGNASGIHAEYSSLLSGNRVHGQSDTGVAVYSGAVARNNVVYDNPTGMYNSSSTVAGNRVYHNSGTGIVMYYSGTAEANEVYSNTTGIDTSASSFSGQIANNLVYANTNRGLRLYNSAGSRVINNTVYQEVGDAVYVEGSSTNGVTLRNNILWVQAGYDISVASNAQTAFSSNYNLLYQGVDPNAHVGLFGGVTRDSLVDWRAATAQDAQSVEGDPMFVDINGADNVLGYSTLGAGYDGGPDDNFELVRQSWAIDRADAWYSPPTDILGRSRLNDPATVNNGSRDYALSNLGSNQFTASGTAKGWQSNNTYWALTFPGGFTFPFYENTYSSVNVSTEGLLFFSGTMSAGDGANSTDKFLANRIIAPLWDNVRTNATGDNIYVDTTVTGQVTVRWNATVEADSSDANFAVTLFSDGRIRFDYGTGNANLTPTVGISRGDGRFYLQPSYDGQATLSSVNSVQFALVSGLTYVDIGAYEFQGTSDDTTPPRVTGVVPAEIAAGATVGSSLNQIQVQFNEAINAIDGNAVANYELRRAVNGIFGDADDVVYPLSPSYAFTPATGASVTTLTLATAAAVRDTYRFTVRGSVDSAIHDTAGNRLDGDANGTVGPDYVCTFQIWPNIAPQAAADSYAMDEDGVLTVSAPGVRGNDSDPDGDAIQVTAVNTAGLAGTLQAWGADGSFTYRPAADFNGLDGFDYTISDGYGGTATAHVAITVRPGSDVVGRYLFYNNSAFDGGSAAANTLDYNAIAPAPSLTGHGHAAASDEPDKELGKRALLPGQTATFVNYSSYAKGINGILLAFDNLADPVGLTAADFAFRVGNSNTLGDWTAAPAPAAIRVEQDVVHPSFSGHPDVVTITWADDDPYTKPREAGAISNQWLQVTVLSTAHTGLPAADVFYWGNQIGEAGNSASDTNVDQNDEIGARNHPHTAFNPAPPSDPYDFNRDGKVDQNDEILARNNPASAFTRIALIAAPSMLRAAGACAARRTDWPGAAAGGGVLDSQSLAPIVTEAIARWQTTGLSANQAESLRQTQFVVANLGGAILGVACPQAKTVYVDDDAAGFGWFLDPSGDQDEEFAPPAGPSGEAAWTGSPAEDRMDLLSAVLHEMGHILGHEDLDAAAEDVMAASLSAGVRRLPQAALHDAALRW